MPALAAATPVLPPVTLSAFEGPLDLLLHLIREHRVDIADIPIVQVTDHYLAFLRATEEMNLTVAGEFLVMAATLLEIKSRMLLPRPPRAEDSADEEGADPRQELIQRLQDYQRYKVFVATLTEWEEDRRALFFRAEADYGNLYTLPVGFGELSPGALLKALNRLLAEAGEDGEQSVSSIGRRKLTLRLAMVSLWRKVQGAGTDGILLEECLARPLVRIEIVLIFLALLELLRQGRLEASQEGLLGQVLLTVSSVGREAAAHV